MTNTITGNFGVNGTVILKRTDINVSNLTSNPKTVVTVNDQANLANDMDVDEVYAVEADIAASGSLTINLSSVLDPMGVPVDLAWINVVYISCKGDLLGDAYAPFLVIGGTHANENPLWFGSISDSANLLKGDVSFHSSKYGWAISSGDVLTLDNPSTFDALVSIVIVGKQA